MGGSGTGQHTLGNAADICCIGQDGQPISSKLVCCAAQDIGFTGIANINDSYTYTHVDVRPGSKWYGNEVHGNGTATTDFYQYFGISKESTAAKKEDDAMMKGIDVSVHNGTIDWQKLRRSGRRNPAPSSASGADGDGRCIEGRIPEPYQGTAGVHSVPAETPDI